MKNLTPLFASAILLAGCAGDDSANPWSNEQERADARVARAETAPATVATAPGAVTERSGEIKYSWQKKAAEAPKDAEAVAAIPAGKAVVSALRADAGLIQIKIATAPAAGEKLVLTKDAKSLLVTVHSVEGDAVIADIEPLQVNTPTITVGDEVACATYEAPAAK